LLEYTTSVRLYVFISDDIATIVVKQISDVLLKGRIKYDFFQRPESGRFSKE